MLKLLLNMCIFVLPVTSQRNIDELGSCLYFLKLNLSEEKFAAQFLAQLFTFHSATLSRIKAQVRIYRGEWLSVNVHLMITILPAANTTNKPLPAKGPRWGQRGFSDWANTINTDRLFVLKIQKKSSLKYTLDIYMCGQQNAVKLDLRLGLRWPIIRRLIRVMHPCCDTPGTTKSRRCKRRTSREVLLQ